MSNLLQDVLGLNQIRKSNPEKKILVDNTIETGFYDIQHFNAVSETMPQIQQATERGLDFITTFKNLSEDIFLNLYKANPIPVEKQMINPSRRFNADIMNELREAEGFQDMRSICKLDEFSSCVGSVSLQLKAISRIEQIIEEYKQRQQQKQNNPSNGSGGIPNPIDIINQMAESEQRTTYDEDDIGSGPGLIDDIAEQPQGEQSDAGQSIGMTDNAAEKLAQMQQEYDDANGDQVASDIASALEEATQEALQDIRETNDIIQQWGFGGDATSSRISFESKRAAVEHIRNSPKLSKLADILGKFKALARNKLKEKSIGEGNTIHSVTTGNRIEKVLPSELMNLSNEITKKNFYKKLYEGGLAQYETSNDKRKGLGPVICCEDISGSMQGGRTTWARAVTLSLLEIAQRQNRDFYIIFFDDYIEEHEILKKELDPEEVIRIAEVHTRGGTNFRRPVERALQIVESVKAFRKADIVFITDGDCKIAADTEDKLIRVKKKLKVKIQTILIDSANKSSVKRWSDSVQSISALTDMNEGLAESLFENIVSDTVDLTRKEDDVVGP